MSGPIDPEDTCEGYGPAPHVVEPSLGHRFTIAEAAEACSVSRDTIKRRRGAGRFPHAEKGPSGAWLIPLADLVEDGLHPNAPRTPEGDAPSGPDPARVTALEAEVRMLRAVLDERERALNIAERALAALPAPVTDAPPSPTEPHVPRRKWWQRDRIR